MEPTSHATEVYVLLSATSVGDGCTPVRRAVSPGTGRPGHRRWDHGPLPPRPGPTVDDVGGRRGRWRALLGRSPVAPRLSDGSPTEGARRVEPGGPGPSPAHLWSSRVRCWSSILLALAHSGGPWGSLGTGGSGTRAAASAMTSTAGVARRMRTHVATPAARPRCGGCARSRPARDTDAGVAMPGARAGHGTLLDRGPEARRLAPDEGRARCPTGHAGGTRRRPQPSRGHRPGHGPTRAYRRLSGHVHASRGRSRGSRPRLTTGQVVGAATRPCRRTGGPDAPVSVGADTWPHGVRGCRRPARRRPSVRTRTSTSQSSTPASARSADRPARRRAGHRGRHGLSPRRATATPATVMAMARTWRASSAARDNGVGVVGVAPGARLWAVRVFDSPGPRHHLHRHLRHRLGDRVGGRSTPDRPMVANMSLRGTDDYARPDGLRRGQAATHATRSIRPSAPRPGPAWCSWSRRVTSERRHGRLHPGPIRRGHHGRRHLRLRWRTRRPLVARAEVAGCSAPSGSGPRRTTRSRDTATSAPRSTSSHRAPASGRSRRDRIERPDRDHERHVHGHAPRDGSRRALPRRSPATRTATASDGSSSPRAPSTGLAGTTPDRTSHPERPLLRLLDAGALTTDAPGTRRLARRRGGHRGAW